MVAWALVPWLNLAIVLATEAAGWAVQTDHSREVANRVAVSFAIVLSLCGARSCASSKPSFRDRDRERCCGGPARKHANRPGPGQRETCRPPVAGRRGD